MARTKGQIDLNKQASILEAAAQLLIVPKPTLNVAEVARTAGVSKQTIYNTFGCKADLIAAVGEIQRCEGCGKIMKPGDRYYPDYENGGQSHAACIGGDPESFHDGETLEPLPPGSPIPEPAIWTND